MAVGISTTPRCARALLGLLAWPLAFALPMRDDPRRTHVYALSGSAQVPSHGMLGMQMEVQLCEVGRDAGGARLVRLVIPRAPTLVDRHGTRHTMITPPYVVHEYPFFFRQTADGRLLEVLHHPNETSVAVDLKRDLASTQQLVSVSDALQRMRRRLQLGRPDPTHVWERRERDVGGEATARYRLQAHRAGWYLSKRLVYDPAEQFTRTETNLTALLHQNATAFTIRQSSYTHLVPDTPDDAENETTTYSTEGRTLWPDRPTRTRWRLLQVCGISAPSDCICSRARLCPPPL